MDLYDWLLALHVLSAFSLVAALVLFSVVIAFGWSRDRPSEVLRLFRAARVGDALFAIGAIGSIVFGIWLAIEVDAYSILDAWVIAALVLWAVLMETGRREGNLYNRARDRARELGAESGDAGSGELRELQRSQPALLFHAASCVLAFLLLLDMIWKPGA